MPFFSIILPVFNAKNTIESCINSILSQNFKDYELIILDACSTDGTLKLINRLIDKNKNVKLISEKDKGVYDAMNRGIELSRGEWLYFIGSDDKLHNKNTLNEIFNNINSNIDFLYGNVYLNISNQIYSGESNINRLIRDGISICHQSIFYRKSIFDSIGNYNLKYPVHADYDFNVRCFMDQRFRIKYIDTIVCVYNETGLSSKKNKNDQFHSDLKNIYLNIYLNPSELYEEYLLVYKKYHKIINSRFYPIFFHVNKLLKKLNLI